MAEESGDKEQKTENASDRRLQQAFDEGDIALSKEVASTGAFVLGVGVLVSLGLSLEYRLSRMVTETMMLAPSAPFSSLPSMLAPVLAPLFGILGAIAAGGIILTVIQTRGHLWGDKVVPDMTRVFNLERLTHIVSKDFLVDLAVSLVKVVAVMWMCWSVLRADFLTLGKLMQAGPGDQLEGIFSGLWRIAIRAIGIFIVFAGADFALTRFRYRKRHMMTKDEIKREMREDEGDPHIKGARKRRHRELVRQNALAETKRADAIIVNPTHIAIAIRYRKDEGAAPKVLAKGKGVLAEAMRDQARSNAIPIVQDIPLARLLYKRVKVGGEVPADTYKAVAAILALVFKMTGRSVADRREAQL